MKTVLFLTLLSCTANAEIIRLSLVSNEPTPGYTRHQEEGRDAVFILYPRSEWLQRHPEHGGQNSIGSRGVIAEE